MITAAHVLADVVNIRGKLSVMPSDLVADANVLYWCYYRNFPSLAYARGRSATPPQAPIYSAFWPRAQQAKTRCHVVAATLGEFAETAEYAELEAIWRTDSPRPQPDPMNPTTEFNARVCKFARYHYARLLQQVRKDVQTMIARILNDTLLLPQFPKVEDAQTHTQSEWLASSGDFPDAFLVATAKQQAVPHILSDDMDLATFAAITLYTANQKAIDAARIAGKLR